MSIDDQVVVEEDRVDREPHEEHVNRAGGAEQDPLTGRQARADRVAPALLERARRHEQVLADDAPVLTGQPTATSEANVDVVSVVAQRERRAAQAEQRDDLLRLQLGGEEEQRADSSPP